MCFACDVRTCGCVVCATNLLSILFHKIKRIFPGIIETALEHSNGDFRTAVAYLCHRLDLTTKGDGEIDQSEIEKYYDLPDASLIAMIPGFQQLGADQLLATHIPTFFNACMAVTLLVNTGAPLRGPLHNYTHFTKAHASPSATEGADLSSFVVRMCGRARQHEGDVCEVPHLALVRLRLACDEVDERLSEVAQALRFLSVSELAREGGAPEKPTHDTDYSDMPELASDSEAEDTKEEEEAGDSNDSPPLLLDISILPPAVIDLFAPVEKLSDMVREMVVRDFDLDGRMIIISSRNILAQLWKLARFANGMGLDDGGIECGKDRTAYPADEIEDLARQVVKYVIAAEAAKSSKKDDYTKSSTME